MNKTSIEWTTFSSNPIKYRRKSDGKVVWGCVKTSPGCSLCYAEAVALRFNRGKLFNARNMEELEVFLDEKELRQIMTAKKVDGVEVSGSRCFLGDMTDIFGEWVPDLLLEKLFASLIARPDVTFQLLTKRANRLQEFMEASYVPGGIIVHLDEMDGHAGHADWQTWPPKNIWLGVSVEDQKRADERVPLILATRSVVRFLSVEPLLGPVRLFNDGCPYPIHVPVGPKVSSGTLDWVIIGGESGIGARSCNVGWIRDLVKQCKGTLTPCFVKQLGYDPVQAGLSKYLPPYVTGVVLSDKKGGDPSEWPEDLRVREFPHG